MAGTYTLDQAFVELQSRAAWVPPDNITSATDIIAYIITNISNNNLSFSDSYLARIFGGILNE